MKFCQYASVCVSWAFALKIALLSQSRVASVTKWDSLTILLTKSWAALAAAAYSASTEECYAALFSWNRCHCFHWKNMIDPLTLRLSVLSTHQLASPWTNRFRSTTFDFQLNSSRRHQLCCVLTRYDRLKSPITQNFYISSSPINFSILFK